MKVLFVRSINHGKEIDIATPLPPILRFPKPHTRRGFIDPDEKVEYVLRYWGDGNGVVSPIYCTPSASEDDVVEAMNKRDYGNE